MGKIPEDVKRGAREAAWAAVQEPYGIPKEVDNRLRAYEDFLDQHLELVPNEKLRKAQCPVCYGSGRMKPLPCDACEGLGVMLEPPVFRWRQP
jgi:hypothetical protein